MQPPKEPHNLVSEVKRTASQAYVMSYMTTLLVMIPFIILSIAAFSDGAAKMGFAFLSPILVVLISVTAVLTVRYGKDGTKWLTSIREAIKLNSEWIEVNVQFYTNVSQENHRTQRTVLISYPNRNHHTSVLALAGSGTNLAPGKAYTWGAPEKGNVVIIQSGSQTLWPARRASGKLVIKSAHVAAGFSPNVRIKK